MRVLECSCENRNDLALSIIFPWIGYVFLVVFKVWRVLFMSCTLFFRAGWRTFMSVMGAF